MKTVGPDEIKQLYVPAAGSHKGQNGRLLIIGGSHLFHAASLWALTVASRIVDLVHYSSVPENNQIVQKAKEEFKNGIVVPREHVEEYIEEDDCILIGPGMVRKASAQIPNPKSQIPNKSKIQNLNEINEIQDEGEQTEAITNYLLAKYPQKQWVIDAGALQMLDVALIPRRAILTPHHREFEDLVRRAEVAPPEVGTLGAGPATQGAEVGTPWSRDGQGPDFPDVHKSFGAKAVTVATKGVPPRALNLSARSDEDKVKLFAKRYQCSVLLKGEKDIASDGKEVRIIEGGNVGMTKGGTGDVLAGLIAALACKNDPFLATITGSFINKCAGDALYEKVGPYFNATDLANQIPVTMKELLLGVN